MTHESLTTLESSRLEFQRRLDAAKTANERNKLGQFATPAPLAIEIATAAKSILRDSFPPIDFCDPALGTGSFYSALLHVFSPDSIASASGVEIDPAFRQTAARLWEHLGLRAVEGDFTNPRVVERLPKPNLVLTNPPYVRHHHLGSEQKKRLGALVARATGIRLSGLSGLYVYYLILATEWMAEKGLAAWLIPAEFMDVNYGKALREFLAKRTNLLRIHRFNPEDVQFDDALVSSVVVFFEKRKAVWNHRVQFTYGSSLVKPEQTQEVAIERLLEGPKWSCYPTANGIHHASGQNQGGPLLGDLFKIQRGIATGANEFFVLSREEACGRGFPSECLKPILPSPRNITEAVIDADNEGFPQVCPQLVVIDCSLGEKELESKHPQLWEYLNSNASHEVRKRYLTRHRELWYQQEQRSPAPFLCTYMGRQTETKQPLRFLWNKSQATAANVYLLLYPIGPLAALLRKKPSMQGRVFELLNQITTDDLREAGRVYGGGLHKVEPKELANVSAIRFLRLIPDFVGTPDMFAEDDG